MKAFESGKYMAWLFLAAHDVLTEVQTILIPQSGFQTLSIQRSFGKLSMYTCQLTFTIVEKYIKYSNTNI